MNILSLYFHKLSFKIFIFFMEYVLNILDIGYFISKSQIPKLLFDDRCFIKRKLLVLIDKATYACVHITFGSSHKGVSTFETKESTFESLCILLTIMYQFFSFHQFLFPHHFPTCHVHHRMQTMTKHTVHPKLVESLVRYPNGHNLWFGSSMYYYFDMIFTKILVKNKFSKHTCNYPPFSNCNFIDSKCHISFHISTSFQFQGPWQHLGDFLTHAN